MLNRLRFALPTNVSKTSWALDSSDNLETDYKIIVITGEKGLEEGVVTVHLHGDFRVVPITLKDSTTNEKPFQSNSTDEFECRATEVDRIRRIHVEHNGTDRPQLWDLKSVIVRTGRQTIT